MKGISPETVYNFLKGVNYPARKDDLIKQARKNNADTNILEALETLPDQEYQTRDDVIRIGSEIFHQ